MGLALPILQPPQFAFCPSTPPPLNALNFVQENLSVSLYRVFVQYYQVAGLPVHVPDTALDRDHKQALSPAGHGQALPPAEAVLAD